MKEDVWVVPLSALEGVIESRPGIYPLPSPERWAWILDQAFFARREQMETDPRFKQIIPYVTFCFQDKVLVMERLKGGGEKRLHHRLSIGVGGHLNPQDAGASSGLSVIASGLEREIREEVRLASPCVPQLTGLIEDSSNAVGSVHLGLCFLATVRSLEVESLEPSRLTVSWRSLDELQAAFDRLETWSQLVLQERLLKAPDRLSSID